MRALCEHRANLTANRPVAANHYQPLPLSLAPWHVHVQHWARRASARLAPSAVASPCPAAAANSCAAVAALQSLTSRCRHRCHPAASGVRPSRRGGIRGGEEGRGTAPRDRTAIYIGGRHVCPAPGTAPCSPLSRHAAPQHRPARPLCRCPRSRPSPQACKRQQRGVSNIRDDVWLPQRTQMARDYDRLRWTTMGKQTATSSDSVADGSFRR